MVWRDETLSMRRMGVVCRGLFGGRPGRLFSAGGISCWMRARAFLDQRSLVGLLLGEPTAFGGSIPEE